MKRLSVADAGWLLIEARERPMHVGGLQLFELPEDAGPGYLQQVVRSSRREHEVRYPFDRRLARPYGRAGTYHWVTDDDVEVDYHVRHVALPDPGRVRELLVLVSRLHGNLLDRHRPLWESYLIEGLEGNRFALYTKIHHSMLDGVAAMRQVLKAFSTDPTASDDPPPWAQRPGEGRSEPSRGGLLSTAAATLGAAFDATTSTLGVTRTLATQLMRSTIDAAEVVPFQAPRSMLNVKLTAARRFVAQSYDLERIRRVGKALDATINDVVLTMCSSALRAYLLDQGALPDKPLIALVPVSFRRDDDTDSGNAISLVPANLATHLDAPVDRLSMIRESMNRVKARLRDMSQTELLEYGLLMTAPLVLGNLTGLSGRVRPSYNVVISNVPGPSQSLYWNGARMQGMYPLSLLTEGYALNITQTSYAGSMEFGITADRRALPSVQRLIDHLEDALRELESAAGV